MTARDVLDKVLEAGGKVISDPNRPRLVVPSDLKPLVSEYKEELRALVLQDSGESLPSCGSPACKGCYEIPGGRRIHPPQSSTGWRRWLEKWQPGNGQLQ